MIYFNTITARINTLKILVLSVVVLFFLYAANAQAQEKVYRAAIDSDGVQRVEVTGGSYYYDPSHIIVKVNVPVELTFKKTPGITPHNIKINGTEAGIEINEDMGDKPKTVTFTPVKTGKFSIYCDKKFLFFKNHREQGMEGVIEVVK